MSYKVEPNVFKPSTNKIRTILTAFYKAKFKILFFAVFTSMFAVFLGANQANTYKSTLQLQISTNSAEKDSGELFLTQVEILRSRLIATKVIEKLNLVNSPKSTIDHKFLDLTFKTQLQNFISSTLLSENKIEVSDRAEHKEYLISLLKNSISIEPIKDTKLINISFSSTDPKFSALVANTIAKVYKAQEMKNALLETKQFVFELKNDLIYLNSFLLNGQKEEAAEERYPKRDQSVTTTLTIPEIKANYVVAKRNSLKFKTFLSTLKQIDPEDSRALLNLSEVDNDPILSQVLKKKISAKIKLIELNTRYGNKHPKIISIKKELREFTNSVNKQLSQMKDICQKQLRDSIALESDLKAQFAVVSSQQIKNNKKAPVRNHRSQLVKRNNELDLTLYTSLIQSLQRTSFKKNYNKTQSRVIEPAMAQFKPNQKKIVDLAIYTFLITVLFCLIIITIKNRRVKKLSFIDRILTLDIKLLAILPKILIKKKDQFPSHIYFDTFNKKYSDCIKTLRSNFLLLSNKEDCKIVLVTSGSSKEGKTTAAINLAFSMAKMKKTLLIEADLRSPVFAKIFKLPPFQNGLANVLLNDQLIDNSIICDPRSEVDFLSAGSLPADPQELFFNDSFPLLLTELGKKYEQIIIDSPSMQGSSDPLILAKFADTVIFVTNAETTDPVIVERSLSILRDHGIKLNGIVINNLDIKKLKNKEDLHGFYDFD